jgi:hypothetical protein
MAGAIIIDRPISTGSRLRRSIARAKANSSDMDGRASGRGRFIDVGNPRRQLKPISTAMRIRSEWFFAPSFCFSKEVVLATVL